MVSSPASPAANAAEAASAAGTRGPSATSDRLVVLGVDGRARLVRHALASEGAIVRLALPDGIDVRSIRFAGPERATFAEARRRTPDRVALWSGSVVVSYHDERAPEADATGTFRERVSSVPESLSVADGALASSRLTWVLPETLELVAFDSGEESGGRWTMVDGVLTHEQTGGVPATLEIAWRARGGEPVAEPDIEPDAEAEAETVGELAPASASVEADVDADGVPDARDVCLDPFGEISDPANVDRFGCEREEGDGRDVLVVDGIVFPAGKSYLDGDARAVLDRVARALIATADGELHEIAAHTDGAGSRARNLRLSERRAEAVRHYLMLRGVGPNRLRARGYGEGVPRAGDATAAGRRANRRIELERVEPR